MKIRKIFGIFVVGLVLGTTVAFASEVQTTVSTSTDTGKRTIEQRKENIDKRSAERQEDIAERQDKIAELQKKIAEKKEKLDALQTKLDAKFPKDEKAQKKLDEQKAKLLEAQKKLEEGKNTLEERDAKLDTIKANNVKIVDIRKQILDKIAVIKVEIKVIKGEDETKLTDEQKAEIKAKSDKIKEVITKIKGLRDEVIKSKESDKGLDGIIARQNMRITTLSSVLEDLNK